MILELTGWRRSSTKIMSSITIVSLPKKSNTPSEKVRKIGGDLDDTKHELLTTTYTVVKEGNSDMFDKEGGKQKLLRKPSLLLLNKNKN